MYFPGRKPPPDKMNFQFFRHLWMAKLYEVKTEAPEEKALPHKDINRIPFMSKARGHQKIW